MLAKASLENAGGHYLKSVNNALVVDTYTSANADECVIKMEYCFTVKLFCTVSLLQAAAARSLQRKQADPLPAELLLWSGESLHDHQHQPVRLHVRRDAQRPQVLCCGAEGSYMFHCVCSCAPGCIKSSLCVGTVPTHTPPPTQKWKSTVHRLNG